MILLTYFYIPIWPTPVSDLYILCTWLIWWLNLCKTCNIFWLPVFHSLFFSPFCSPFVSNGDMMMINFTGSAQAHASPWIRHCWRSFMIGQIAFVFFGIGKVVPFKWCAFFQQIPWLWPRTSAIIRGNTWWMLRWLLGWILEYYATVGDPSWLDELPLSSLAKWFHSNDVYFFNRLPGFDL